MTNEEIIDSLKKVLKRGRFEHSLGVAYTAASLAMRYGYDVKKAFRAGLLHDCTKYMDAKESLEYCKKNKIKISDVEKKNASSLLHSKTGAHMACFKYGEKDEEILNAIRFHTTGKPDMTELEKIIIIADYIEPNRKELPQMADIRAMAFEDLNKCLVMMYESIIGYINQGPKSGSIDNTTIEAYNFYKEKFL